MNNQRKKTGHSFEVFHATKNNPTMHYNEEVFVGSITADVVRKLQQYTNQKSSRLGEKLRIWYLEV